EVATSSAHRTPVPGARERHGPKTRPPSRAPGRAEGRMDPLVRAALALQQLVFRGAGVLLSVGLGLYVVCYAADPPPELATWIASGLWGVSVLWHAVSRWRSLGTEVELRRDLQLFMNLVTGVYAGILHLPGDLSGPFYPAI